MTSLETTAGHCGEGYRNLIVFSSYFFSISTVSFFSTCRTICTIYVDANKRSGWRCDLHNFTCLAFCFLYTISKEALLSLLGDTWWRSWEKPWAFTTWLLQWSWTREWAKMELWLHLQLTCAKPCCWSKFLRLCFHWNFCPYDSSLEGMIRHWEFSQGPASQNLLEKAYNSSIVIETVSNRNKRIGESCKV